MVVYIKGQSGEIYASPVFAEIGKGWNIKSVVLNEAGDCLILLPLLKKGFKYIRNNYFYIDETVQDGWVKSRRISGFPEIIKNKALLKQLKHGKAVSIDGLNIINEYNLPLPVITKFEVKTEQDVSTFDTVCWGLHDAYIEKIDRIDNDLIVNFDTNWEKHIIVTFHNVTEDFGLDNIACILDSTFKIEDNRITWEVTSGFDSSWNGLDERQVYIVAEKITWELLID